jgi:hypothetical protein
MNRSYSKIRHILESNLILEKRKLNETFSDQSTMMDYLKKSFPDVDEMELNDKWEEFKKALGKCIGEDEMKKLTLSTAISIVTCIMFIFGAVYSFGLVALVGGGGCATGVISGGMGVYDVIKCVTKELGK